MLAGDRVLTSPRSGKGASLVVRYVLPRESPCPPARQEQAAIDDKLRNLPNSPSTSSPSGHTQRGKDFQRLAAKALAQLTGASLLEEVRIAIGEPAKEHVFDLATPDLLLVAECKAFTFTATGKSPSAKISILLEAVMYLRYLPAGTTRVLLMQRSDRASATETLAEYFVRLKKHLIRGIWVIEVSEDGKARFIHGKL